MAGKKKLRELFSVEKVSSSLSKTEEEVGYGIRIGNWRMILLKDGREFSEVEIVKIADEFVLRNGGENSIFEKEEVIDKIISALGMKQQLCT